MKKFVAWCGRFVRRFHYNAPVVLTFALLSLLVLALDALTGGASTRACFCVYRSSLLDPLFYVRLFGHALGHSDFAHYVSNMGLLLILGPAAEQKYGAKKLIGMFCVTALATGVMQCLFSANTAALGASGIVFMLMMLAAVTGREGNRIPLTLVLVAVIYLGQEIADGLFTSDNVSQLAHIVGGGCGIAMGLIARPKTGTNGK